MKINKNQILFILFLFLSYTIPAQVKIGDPTGPVDPKAVLELKDTTRGFLLPRMSTTNMNAISTPPDGLLIFNNTEKNIYQYNATAALWKPIVADSSEWYYEPATTKLYFRRALANQDSLYYNTSSKKWIFADSRNYKTVSGSVFNLDEGNSDRFIFKTTASKYLRPVTNLNSANLWSIYEVDNDTLAASHPFEASYYGLAASATVTPQATQRIGVVYGISAAVASAARDSVSLVYGISNTVSLRGKGFHEVAYGLSNIVGIRDSTTTIGTVFGIENRITYSSPLGTPRVTGDYFGYYSANSTAFNNKVDGSAYGIFLGSVAAAGANRNYGIYTGKGPSRFGDSVLITDIGPQRPRAVFDINATSAMILPAGTTAQRPALLTTGMFRYNFDNATPEVYTGTAWANVKNPVLAATALLDPPLIANNNSGTVNYTFTGAAVGNTVTISPAAALPGGIVIAWATVIGVNQVTVGFANFSGAAVDLPAQNFYIKLVQ